MVYAAISSVLPKSHAVRGPALELCRAVGQPGDSALIYELDLGGRGLDNRVKQLGDGYDGVEGADVLHSFIVNSVKALKRRTKKRATTIYPGRDVWCWEVVSRRLGLPSVYDSRVSRCVAETPALIKSLIAEWQVPDWRRTVLFDSGYAGTVPRAIGRAAGLDEMRVVMLSAVNPEEQVFPTHAKARKKALACEYLAKYRRRAVVRDGKVYQELADLDEFIKAALLTIWLWYHVSPARLPAWNDKPVFVDGGVSVASIPTISVPGSFFGGTGNVFNTFTPVPTMSTGGVGPAITTTTPYVLSTSSATTTSSAPLDQLWLQGAATSSVGGLAPLLDPNTYQLLDPITLQPLPGQANTPLPSNHPPQGYGLGQYPGPPVQGPASVPTPPAPHLQPKSPNPPMQRLGGPGSGSAPTPTTSGQGRFRFVKIPGVPTPVVADRNGKPITG